MIKDPLFRMKRRRKHVCDVLLIVWSLGTTVTASLPYNPSRAYVYGSSVYVLDPPSASLPSGQLKTFSTSSRFSVDSVPFSTATSSLPWLDQGSPSISYTCALASNGEISVYAGSCAEQDPQASLWLFDTATDGGDDGPSWTQLTLDSGALNGVQSQGVSFLGNAMAFIPDNTRIQPDVYILGGMCPLANATIDTWTTAASYSNSLTLMSPSSDYSTYVGTTSAATGQQPIPEAGFSITPLQPAWLYPTDGSQTMQQDFLLVGGHTQTAFINMSQVALFSLPQASWTFLPVSQPTSGKTDLLRRQDDEIEPRSGHTATLSEDGSKIVLFGGWVGDVNTPAEPQLAVMDVGLGYGGASSSWMWNAATSTGQPSIAAGAGLYGHAAVLLPGNVIMIYGGYAISSTSSARVRKRADQEPSSAVYLYNITSGSWSDTYDPRAVVGGSDAAQSDGSQLSGSRKAGIGAGIGVAIAVLSSILVALLLYWRKLKKRRIEKEHEVEHHLREKELGDLQDELRNPRSAGPAAGPLDRSNLPTDGIWDGRSISGQGTYPWPTGGNTSIPGWKRAYGRDAERSGLDVEIPSPNRGLRKNNGNPFVTARYDDSRSHRTLRKITVIDEADEDDAIKAPPQMQMRGHQRIGSTSRLLEDADPDNPFRDPSPVRAINKTRLSIPRKPVGSSPPLGGPEPAKVRAERRTKEMEGWVRNWAAADAVLSGRNSPDKSDRTRSDLSERSTFSSKSDKTTSSSGQSGNLFTPSRLALNILPAALNPFTVSFDSNSLSAAGTAQGTSPTRSFGPTTPATDPFTTSPGGFAHLQAESETLLGTHPHTSHVSSGYSHADTPPSFLQSDFQPRNRPPPSRTRSKVGTWMLGSVRRAIPAISLASNRSSSMTSTTVRPRPDSSGGFPDYPDNSPRQMSGLPSAATPETSLEPPRRTLSDGGKYAFWTSKKGAAAWDYSPHGKPETSTHDGTQTRKRSGSEADCTARPIHTSSSSGVSFGDEDADWDPETAIQERTVQVMFTVPRERLRVVNTDIDAESVGTASRKSSGGDKGDAGFHVSIS